jgi:hypothetical protein
MQVAKRLLVRLASATEDALVVREPTRMLAFGLREFTTVGTVRPRDEVARQDSTATHQRAGDETP